MPDYDELRLKYNYGSLENPPYYVTAYGIAVKHGYQGTEEEWIHEIQESAHDSSIAAAESAASALQSKGAAEAYGAGTRGGEPLEEDDPAYHNNAQYYSANADTKAAAAADSAEDSEAYAIGKRSGVDVDSDDPAYHNNSKYYSDLAKDYAEDTGGLVTETVLGYLEETITNPDSPPLDRALTSAVSAAPADLVGELKSNLKTLNAFDLLQGNHTNINYSANGTTWHWDGEVCNVNGTATASTVYDMYRDFNAFPSWLTPGQTVYVKYSGVSVRFAVYQAVGGSLVTTPLLDTTNYDGLLTIPTTASGIAIRYRMAKNTTANNEKAQVSFANYEPNQKLQELVHNIKNPIMDKGSITGIYLDVDNIVDDSIYFVSSSGGQPTALHTPYYPCWIVTVGYGGVNTNISLQVVYPYNTTDVIQFRRKASGVWGEWKQSGGTTTIIQEVSRDTYENTYNITTTPSITTDSNGWLQPVDTNTADETGKTDMTGAIMSMLTDTGYCHLAPGIYYVSGGIDLPTGATLEGCGRDTIIRLLGSVTSGYIARLKEYSTLKNIRFSGGYSDGDISNGNIGGRKGVIFIGNRDGTDTGVTPAKTKCCQIEGCWFENLDSGIYGYNAGGGLQEGMEVCNCYFTRCKAGINLDYWVEYSKFTNCITFQCYYGCINNGGNNVFTACTFHGVIGFLIDNSGGNKQNCGHGSVVNCTFNHIDNMNNPTELGKGIGIKVLGISYGFIFANCQLWYGRVHIEDSSGVQITGCEFGGLGGSSYPAIETSGTNMVFVDNCLFQTSPSLSISSPIKMTNCWTYDGTAVTVS